MVCTNCQRHIADGSNFCYSCGAKQPAPGAAGVNAAQIRRQERLVAFQHRQENRRGLRRLADISISTPR